jgi:hypothetical protein
MVGLHADLVRAESISDGDSLERVVTDLDSRRAAREAGSQRPLQCVSSGYLGDGCSCRSMIPAAVVAAAWCEERRRGGPRGDRFFRFTWQGGTWLAYGIGDGRIRGVYCPDHSAARDERASVAHAPLAVPLGSLMLSA